MRKSVLPAVAVAAAALIPATSAHAAATDSAGGFAYGIAASGPLTLGPLPAVSHGHSSLVSVPANPLLKAGVLNASAALTRSRASVADAKVLKAVLRAALITAVCTSGSGRSGLADASIAGTRLPATPGPNTRVGPIKVPGVGAVELTLNQQVWKGDRLTVTAIALNVLGQRVSIASASCRAMAPAPAPKPVKSDLPVTG
jgi:hypothetical protein